MVWIDTTKVNNVYTRPQTWVYLNAWYLSGQFYFNELIYRNGKKS